MLKRLYLWMILTMLAAGGIALADSAPRTKRDQTTLQQALIPYKPRPIELDFCPGGLALDGDTLYIAVMGKSPEIGANDEDGGVATLNLADVDAKPKMLTEQGMYGSPTGLCLQKDMLCVNDVDNVYILNKKDGEMDGALSLSLDLPMKHLDGITSLEDGRVVVASRDLNKIYIGDLRSNTFAEIVTQEPLHAPSGVFWYAQDKILYVAEAAMEKVNGKNKPTGRLLMVDILFGSVKEVHGMFGKKLRGQFGSVFRYGNWLVFSDLSQEGRPECLQRLDLKNQKLTNIAPLAMHGMGHFIVRGSQVIVPAAKDKKIYIFNIKK